MTDARPPWTEFALLGLLALLWGSSYGFIKLAVTEIPPMTLIAARGTIAAAMLIALVMIRGDKWPTDARTWGMLLVQAFFNGIGAWTLLAWGQQHIDSGLASVLNSTSPIFVVLITLLILRNGTIGPRATFGAFLGLGGVILMIGVGVLDGLGKEIAGQAAALAGAALYACAALYRSPVHWPARPCDCRHDNAVDRYLAGPRRIHLRRSAGPDAVCNRHRRSGCFGRLLHGLRGSDLLPPDQNPRPCRRRQPSLLACRSRRPHRRRAVPRGLHPVHRRRIASRHPRRRPDQHR